MTALLMQKTGKLMPSTKKDGERGAALALALIIMTLLAALSIAVMAVATSEVKVAGSDLCRTQAFYAASSSLEKMTSNFSDLFSRTTNPTQGQLDYIAANPDTELTTIEYYTFSQTLAPDAGMLAKLRAAQNLPVTTYPTTNISDGPYAGLTATIVPYLLTSTATQQASCNAQVKLQRSINNYLIPIFQFGVFSNEDLELHPGEPLFFNGRIHANGNFYLNGDVTLLDKVTTPGELVTDVTRNGVARTGSVQIKAGGSLVDLTKGSVNNGPSFSGATSGQRGYNPGSFGGTANSVWESNQAAPVDGTANKFGGQVLTGTIGAKPLRLPLELGNSSTEQLIKRKVSTDDTILTQSRYANKARVRILIDDESAGSGSSNDAGIPAGKGVALSSFDPIALNGGKALQRVLDNGTYNSTDAATPMRQGAGPYSTSLPVANIVRGVKSSAVTPSGCGSPCAKIPAGAGLKGRIYIEIVAANGASFDVTTQVLSLGMTEGEPNGIVYLQRPLWAAFMQGSRDRSGGNNNLANLTNLTRIMVDGEINSTYAGTSSSFATRLSALTGEFTAVSDNFLDDDNPSVTSPFDPTTPLRADTPAGYANAIVPIQAYNVREGWVNGTMDKNQVYERGIQSVVEINMKNLARWLDGSYDTLLGGTAVSANIDDTGGYIVYISDRRGDRIKQEKKDATSAAITTTNGTVDNEDIYGPNGTLDPGEDVIDFGYDGAGVAKKGTLQKDTLELPDWPGTQIVPASPLTNANRMTRAENVAKWVNQEGAAHNYFRRAVRLFNGEDLQTTGAANKLSSTKGITVASENMLYVWGNYNTTGINCQPGDPTPTGSTINQSTAGGACGYNGRQVPASFIADAVYPISKTWFDSSPAMYPEGGLKRLADVGLTLVSQGTSVRSAIIAGRTLSALTGSPDNNGSNRLAGGLHNFPRFSEVWNGTDAGDPTYLRKWNYSGSLAPLFHSTQAVGQWNTTASTIYWAPTRNWSFDITFKDPTKLPPGTPTFEYIQPTGIRQFL